MNQNVKKRKRHSPNPIRSPHVVGFVLLSYCAIGCQRVPLENVLRTSYIGDIVSGEAASADFTVVNHFREYMIYDDNGLTNRSCSCVNFSVASHSIAPGDSTVVTIDVDTSRKLGGFAETLTTHWTAGERRVELTFRVNGSVVKPLSINHDAVLLTDATPMVRIALQAHRDVDWKTFDLELNEMKNYVSVENTAEIDARRFEFDLTLARSQNEPVCDTTIAQIAVRAVNGMDLTAQFDLKTEEACPMRVQPNRIAWQLDRDLEINVLFNETDDEVDVQQELTFLVGERHCDIVSARLITPGYWRVRLAPPTKLADGENLTILYKQWAIKKAIEALSDE